MKRRNKFYLNIFILFSCFFLFSCNNVRASKFQLKDNSIKNEMADSNYIPAGYYVLDSADLPFDNQDSYKIIVLEKQEFKNKANVQHHGLIFEILKKKKGEIKFVSWLANQELIKDLGKKCPSDGFQDIVVKGNFFTIEYVVCDGWNFVNCFLTFRYDSLNNQVLLHKFDKSFTDRTNPDKELKSCSYTKKNFGLIEFTTVTDSLLYNLK